MNALHRLSSMKLKISVVIGIAILASSGATAVGLRAGLPLWIAPALAIVVALVIVQVVARGLTAPLRQIAGAARAVQEGDFDVHVATAHTDEVGELAEAFNEMAAELGRTDVLRRELVANAAHELRTPITGVLATIENMVDGVTEVDQRALEGMHGQVQRLAALVDQLLDLSQLDAGTAPLQLGPADLGNIVAAVAHDLATLAERAGVTIDVDVPQAAIVTGDTVRLRQVVTNLVDNAVAHSPAGGAVTVRVSGPHDGHVRLAVTDTGPGIPTADADRVFERFHRSPGARSTGRGAGLGLSIARRIVEQHGGHIAVEPTDAPAGSGAHGARFIVDLPALPTAVPVPATSQEA